MSELSLQNEKEFDDWHGVKKKTAVFENTYYFSEGDVYNIRAGKNVGFEQDGKGELFLRPVLILKKFNKHVFLGAALTTKLKENPYYMSIGKVGEVENFAILSQIRLWDSKRLEYKMGHVDKMKLDQVRKEIARVVLAVT